MAWRKAAVTAGDGAEGGGRARRRLGSRARLAPIRRCHPPPPPLSGLVAANLCRLGSVATVAGGSAQMAWEPARAGSTGERKSISNVGPMNG
uniref:Uncharacterized protein n=1 Tax=Oryza glumipatula TaxID=40148 RepID=A0A0D9Y7X7_9ORYZ